MRRTALDIEKANAQATERMMEARPVLVGLGKALEVNPRHAPEPAAARRTEHGGRCLRASGSVCRRAIARSGEGIIADRLDMLVYVTGEYWSGGERLARHGFSRRESGR